MKAINAGKILMQLQEGLTAKQIEKGQHHRGFEESFDAKPVYPRCFFAPETAIHSFEPCAWQVEISEHWEDYEHSSARFYYKNKMDAFVPVHFEELS